MSTRRDFIRRMGIAGAGLMVPWKDVIASNSKALETLDFFDTASLQKYVDPLPIIPVLKPIANSANKAYYQQTMMQGTNRFHRDMPLTPVWGYGGGYLGATIEARTNQLVGVNWVNNLPGTHLLGIDQNIAGVSGLPDVRVVVHLHGGHVPNQYDGGPFDWFTPGSSKVFWYPNIQEAASLWYHDHALGITRLNVYAGLAGLYLIRDTFEDSLNLPKGSYEIPLVIQDKTFTSDGKLFYPNPWEPEFFGDTILVNGKAWPFLEVEPRKYRFRIYNGANARFFNLKLSSNQPFYQIGAEGGFLPRTVQLTQLLIGNGERADVIIDFTGMKGSEVIMTNDAIAPFNPSGLGGDPVDEQTGQVMKFKVTKTLSGTDTSRIPGAPRAIIRLSPSAAVKTRNITLIEGDGGMVLINNTPFMDSPITENPRLGTTEVWKFINLTPDTHPMHMHLVHFQVLDRQPFNVDAYKNAYGGSPAPDGANLFTTGSPIPADQNERGWKETVRANPGQITRLITKFEDFTGKFVYHCHILDHEENDMMHFFNVNTGSAKDAASVLSTVPAEYALLQNYPNPFNPSTTIKFHLPQQSNVEIKVFNSIGKEMLILAEGLYEAGEHTINWNGTDNMGLRLPSGIYIYTMKAGTYNESRKMILLK